MRTLTEGDGVSHSRRYTVERSTDLRSSSRYNTASMRNEYIVDLIASVYGEKERTT